MSGVRKTVGVYERPENRGGMRAALIIAAAVVVIAVAALAVFVL